MAQRPSKRSNDSLEPLNGGDTYARHLPTDAQTLILKAALFAGNAARAAWEAWLAGGGPGGTDRAWAQAFPLVYANLRRQGEKHPAALTCKFHYLSTLHKNTILFAGLADVLQAFYQAGIRTMLLKGAALVLLYYRDAGARPMADVDLLIPADRAAEAWRLLGRLGWKPTQDFPKIESAHRMVHALNFKNAQGLQIDLHFHAFFECIGEARNAAFWQAARAVRFQGVPTHALSPSDMLLHILVHGAKACEPPAIRWVLDAMTMLAMEYADIDWGRFIETVRGQRLALPARTGLAYLVNVMGAPVPLAVQGALETMPLTLAERLEYKIFSRSFFYRSPLQMFLRLYLPYARIRRDAQPDAQIGSFAEYATAHLGVRHIWHLPFLGAYKGMRRFYLMVMRRRRLERAVQGPPGS